MSFRRTTPLLVVLVLVVAAPVTAQNRYLPDQANGLGAHAMWLVPPYRTGPGFDVVGTFRTRFDVGVAFSHVSSETQGPTGILFAKEQESEVTPHVSYALVRPSRRSNYGFDLVGSYSFISGSGRCYEEPSTDISGHGLMIGGEAYNRVGREGETRYFPALGLAYAVVDRTIDDSVQSADEKADGLLVSASLTVMLGDTFTLGGGIRSFDDEITWIWRVGFVTELR